MARDDMSLEVYQLRVWIQEISPAIWRRLLVRSDSTIADLHYTLQLALGWSDFHLHRFLIRGTQYGVSRSGGLFFRDQADQVRLADFNFRLRERFLYEYDMGDLWQHEVRLEKKLSLEPDKTYPVCIGGGWSVPPEDCGGPWAYLALRQRYSAIYILEQLADMIEYDELDDRWEELSESRYWLKAARFNRREANRRLKLYANADEEWQGVIGEPL